MPNKQAWLQEIKNCLNVNNGEDVKIVRILLYGVKLF